MKFTIDRSAAHEALKKCIAVSTGKSTLPILSCVLIEAGDGQITLSATDLDTYIACTVPAKVETTGIAALPRKMLFSILSKGDEVSIEVDAKHKAIIRSGGSVFKISGVNPGEWPDAPKAPDADLVTMDAHDWLSASRAVKWAASTDAARPGLCGTHIHPQDGKLVFVATNGTVLSRSVTETEGNISCTLLTQSMDAIDSIADGGGALHLRVSDRIIHAECTGCTVFSKVVDYPYPNYRNVIPDWKGKKTTRIKMPVKAFLESLERVSIVLGGNHLRADLDIAPGSVAITAKGIEDEASGSVEAEISGPDLSIGLSPSRLSDPFRRWGSEYLELEAMDNMSPMMVRGGSHEFVIMPMKIQ